MRSIVEQFIELWRAAKGQARLPARSELSLSGLAPLMPHAIMLETDGNSHVIRLAGTSICALFDKELTGLHFSILFGEGERNDLHRLLSGLASDAVPVAVSLNARFDGGSTRRISGALAPLRAPVAGVQILGCLALADEHAPAGEKIVSLSLASIRMNEPTANGQPPRGLGGAGLPSSSVALRRGHLVLLKNPSAQPNPPLHGSRVSTR